MVNYIIIIMNKINKHKKKSPETASVDPKCFSMAELYEKAVAAYQAHDSTSSSSWNAKIAQAGTKRDKITAVATLLMEHP